MDLSYNRLNDDCEPFLVSLIKSFNRFLEKVILTHNYFVTCMKAINEAVCEKTTIRVMDLNHNMVELNELYKFEAKLKNKRQTTLNKQLPQLKSEKNTLKV